MGTPESSGDFGIYLSNTQHKFPNLNNPSSRKGMFITFDRFAITAAIKQQENYYYNIFPITFLLFVWVLALFCCYNQNYLHNQKVLLL